VDFTKIRLQICISVIMNFQTELTKMYKRKKLQANVNMPSLLKPLSHILRCTVKQKFIEGVFKT